MPRNTKRFACPFDTIKQVAKGASCIGGGDLNHTNEIIR